MSEKIALIGATVLTVAGLVTVGVFFVILSGSYSIGSGDSIDLEASAQVGDYIGGLVGALWALAGVLLFFSALSLQRKEFELQRQELVEQRREFACSRVSTLIYNQLDRLDERLSKLSYLPKGGETTAGDSVLQAYSQDHDSNFRGVDRSETESDLKRLYAHVHEKATADYLRYFHSTLEVFDRLTDRDSPSGRDLSSAHADSLKALMLSNIDFAGNLRYLSALKNVSYFATVDREGNQIEGVGTMHKELTEKYLDQLVKVAVHWMPTEVEQVVADQRPARAESKTS